MTRAPHVLALLLAAAPAGPQRWSAVVDARLAGPDGARVGGAPTYRTLGAALAALPASGPASVYLRDGRYREKIVVRRPRVTLVGQSRDGVVLTWDDASGKPRPGGSTLGTFGSYTLRVAAPDFRAEHLTVENAFDYLANARKATDDPTKVQAAQAVALALDSASDRASFEDVRVTGHQDTLYPNAGRAYFHRCEVAGDCWMDDHVGAKGWDRMGVGTDSAGNRLWAEPNASRFYEYHSTGPGAVASPRRLQLTDAEAGRYTVSRVLDGWTHPPLEDEPQSTRRTRRRAFDLLRVLRVLCG